MGNKSYSRKERFDGNHPQGGLQLKAFAYNLSNNAKVWVEVDDEGSWIYAEWDD